MLPHQSPVALVVLLLTFDDFVGGHDDVEVLEVLFVSAIATVAMVYQNFWKLWVICIR